MGGKGQDVSSGFPEGEAVRLIFVISRRRVRERQAEGSWARRGRDRACPARAGPGRQGVGASLRAALGLSHQAGQHVASEAAVQTGEAPGGPATWLRAGALTQEPAVTGLLPGWRACCR